MWKTIFYTMFIGMIMSNSAMASEIHDAVKRNDIRSVQHLINDKKHKIDERDHNGRSPLLIATHLNHIEIAKFLIDSGADVNLKDNIQDSAYLYAGAQGRLEILKYTIKNGADLKSTNRFGGTTLIPAAEKGHLETVKYLLTTSVDINHVNNLGWTALMEAVVLSDGGVVHQNIISELIKAKADVNIPDSNGVTALTHAKKRNFKEIVKLLENVNAK